MAFNISNFKSSFERYGGPAKANLFEIQLSKLPRFMPENKQMDYLREIKFFCSEVTFPAININTSEIAHAGQMLKRYPTAVQNPGPLSAKFLVDSDHQILTFFHNWSQQIVQYSKRGGAFAETDGKLPHEVGFKNDFACDLLIKHFTTDSFPNTYYEAKLYKVFPVAVGALALNWEGASSFLSLDVQFSAEDMEFSSDKTGKTGDRSKRGGGLLDILGDIAGFADTVRGTVKSGRPTSIQDAVNRLNRLGNAVDNLGDNF